MSANTPQAGPVLGPVRERFSNEVSQVREDLSALNGRARDQARRSLRTADQSVHGHVYRAIGIAAVVGLLVGFLSGRR